MSIDMEGRVAYLSGDWTIASLTKWKIELLADVLQQIDAQGGWKLQVDCGNMTSSDRAGLELLHVWLQCARFRGFEPELINLPDTPKMQAPVSVFAQQIQNLTHENQHNHGQRQAA